MILGVVRRLDGRLADLQRELNQLETAHEHAKTGVEYSRRFGVNSLLVSGYVTLMRHWDSLYPGGVLHVSYERLVREPDAQITRILDHCGLAHEPSCFRFWESKRPVLTPSATQVRQPMTEKSISSGQRYEPFIQPHIPALAEITRKAREVFGLDSSDGDVQGNSQSP